MILAYFSAGEQKSATFCAKMRNSRKRPWNRLRAILFLERYFHAFSIKIDFRGIVDNFNAIPAPNLQSEMQKAGSSHGTGSFFRVIFNFSARRIFPATLSKHCFLLSNCWCYVLFCYRKVSLVLLSYRYLKSLKVESRQISIIIFYNIEKNSKKYAKKYLQRYKRMLCWCCNW